MPSAPRQSAYEWIQVGHAAFGQADRLPCELRLASCPSLQANPQHSLQANKGRRKSWKTPFNRFLAREFEAAPWLLPARSQGLPYAGVHGFDELLALRSAPVAGHDKAIALLLFSKAYAVMAQNSSKGHMQAAIEQRGSFGPAAEPSRHAEAVLTRAMPFAVYSLVKHGGVRNYVALTWTAEDLEACTDLNLPCADVTDMLVEPLPSHGGPGWRCPLTSPVLGWCCLVQLGGYRTQVWHAHI